MWCDVCGKHFEDTGTGTSPGVYCYSCLSKGYVKIYKVERTTKEIIDSYNYSIKLQEEVIEEHEERILEAKNNIKWLKEEVDKLTLE